MTRITDLICNLQKHVSMVFLDKYLSKYLLNIHYLHCVIPRFSQFKIGYFGRGLLGLLCA